MPTKTASSATLSSSFPKSHHQLLTDSSCGDCVLKDKEIGGLREYCHQIEGDVSYWKKMATQLQTKLDGVTYVDSGAGGADGGKLPLQSPDHYMPRRGTRIEKCDYIISDDVPQEYCRLVKEVNVNVPANWLIHVQASFRNKSKSYAIKMLINGFYEPEEMAGVTANRLIQTPVGQAIFVYGTTLLQMDSVLIKDAINSKIGTMAIDKMNTEFRLEKEKGTAGLCESETLAMEFMPLELESFQSVVDFAEAFKQTQRPLHVLFCNAGLGLGPYVKTGDGLEMLLQVNYLSQFVLTAKLLPLMLMSGPDCRLLYMSSLAHKMGSFDVNTMNYTGRPRDYPTVNYYGRSKMYQIMQMYCMVRRLGEPTNVTVNSIHPGAVNTRFARDMAGIGGSVYGKLKSWFFSNQHQGAKCSIDCTVNPELAGVTGIYFNNCNRITPSSAVRNEENQEQLWKATIDYVKDYVTEEEWDILEGRKRPSNTDSSPKKANPDKEPKNVTD